MFGTPPISPCLVCTQHHHVLYIPMFGTPHHSLYPSSLPTVSALAMNITSSGSPVAGQSYSLNCTGALVGNASIVSITTWSNATGGIPSGNGITVSGGILTFNPLRTSHGGQYSCLSTLSYPFNSTATTMTNVIVQSM